MLVWLAFAFLLVALGGSSAVAVRSGLGTWRALKSLGNGATGELDRISRSAERIELHLQAAAESGTRLDASLQRLAVSRAKLNVLTAALADARAAGGRLRDVYPRK